MQDYSHFLIFISILIAMVLIFTSLENFYWQKRDKSKCYSIKEVLVNFSLGASYKFFDFIALAVYVFFVYDLVKPYGLNLSIEQSVLSFILLFIVADLGFYFVHLCMHKIRVFWTGHVTHHSSPRYNFSTALRQNFLVTLNGAMLIWWLPLALIGFDKSFVLLAMELNLLYQFLIHTEIPTPKWDKLGWLLNTPSHHRVHHGSNEAQIDRNFAGTFIIWDKLFGTFRSEKDAGVIQYGITDRSFLSWNPFILIFHEALDMFKDVTKYKNINVFIKPPGWKPQEKISTPTKSTKQNA